MRETDEIAEEDSVPEAGEPSLGELLKSARAERSFSLGDVSAELRIEPQVLEALEADELSGIGPPVFVKGYIKQYGRQLGIDYDDLLAAYYRQTDAAEVSIKPNRVIHLRDERQIMVWVVTGLLLLVLAVALFIWWTGAGEVPLAEVTPSERSTPVSEGGGLQRDSDEPAVVEPAPAELVREGVAVSPLADPPAAPELGSAAASPTTNPPAASASVVVENEQFSAPSDDGASLNVRSLTATEPAPGAPPAGENLIAVEIAFVTESWAEVSDARGNQLFYDLGGPGTRTTVYGELPMNFFFGNADGVSLTVDDEPFAIPTGSRRGNLANFVVYPVAN